MLEAYDRSHLVFVLGLSLAAVASALGVVATRTDGPDVPCVVGALEPRVERRGPSPAFVRAPASATVVDVVARRVLGVRGGGSSARTPAAPADEAAIMIELHDLAETDPSRSLALAREGGARYPNGPGAPERAWIVAKSLVHLKRFDEAKAEARAAVAKYPGTSWANDLERHLLTQPLRPDDFEEL